MKCTICRSTFNSDDKFCRRCGYQIAYNNISPNRITNTWLIRLLESAEYKVKVDIKNENNIQAYRKNDEWEMILIITILSSYLRCRTEFPLMDEDLQLDLLCEVNQRNCWDDGQMWYLTSEEQASENSENRLNKLVISERFEFKERTQENELLRFFNSFPGDLDLIFNFLPNLRNSIENQDVKNFLNT